MHSTNSVLPGHHLQLYNVWYNIILNHSIKLQSYLSISDVVLMCHTPFNERLYLPIPTSVEIIDFYEGHEPCDAAGSDLTIYFYAFRCNVYVFNSQVTSVEQNVHS